MGPRIKSAMVTGGGRGLGRAIAERLASSGAKVGVLARTADEVEATARAIREAGGEARGFVADVLDPASLKRAFARFREWAGGLDALVCAAGRLRGIGPMATVDPEEWWLDVETSLGGVSRTIREALPILRGSAHGLDLGPRRPGPCRRAALRLGLRDAQAGLVRLVECLDRELRPERPGRLRGQPRPGADRPDPPPPGQPRRPSMAAGLHRGVRRGEGGRPGGRRRDGPWLAEERPVRLSGRVVPAPATPTILETRLARIESEDLLRLRLR